MESSPPGDERRATLLALRRLLAEAETSVSTGNGVNIEVALRQVVEAFDVYRSQRFETEDSAAQTVAAETRRIALLTFARLLAQIDRSLSRGDVEAITTALRMARQALDISGRVDDPSHESGFRQRFPSKLAK